MVAGFERVREILLCTILMILKDTFFFFFSKMISAYKPALNKE